MPRLLGLHVIRRPWPCARRRPAAPQILERVAAEQTIHVAELARELGVSEMTIRRDIRRLERDGFLRQTYGGATAHLTRSFDAVLQRPCPPARAEKRLIGMRAAELVDDARVLFVGIGTTAEQFARYLPARPDADGRHRLAADRQPARHAARSASSCLGGAILRDELSCIGPVAAATLRVPLRRRRASVPPACRRAVGHHGADRRRGRGPAVRHGAAGSRRRRSPTGRSSAARRPPSSPPRRIATLVTDASAPADELARRAAGRRRDRARGRGSVPRRTAPMSRRSHDGSARADLRRRQAGHRDAPLPRPARAAEARPAGGIGHLVDVVGARPRGAPGRRRRRGPVLQRGRPARTSSRSGPRSRRRWPRSSASSAATSGCRSG